MLKQKNDLLVVIPLGVSNDGTPIQKYIQDCIYSILNQKTDYTIKIVVAADNNIPDRVIKFLNQNNIEISWYEPYTYFRKGGIWKKIYDQWQKYDAEFVAFCHYDDIWHPDKTQNQIEFMKLNNLNNSWCQVYQINDNNTVISNDLCDIQSLSNYTIYKNSYAFCHSSITKKESIFSSNIVKHMEEWSGIYEQLFFVYAHKFKGLKCQTSIFYHRIHNSSITNTFNNETNYNVVTQRNITNYSLTETYKDVNNININNIIMDIINENNFS